jgi:hypothetical protein
MRFELDSFGTRPWLGEVCGCGNEPSGFIKVGEFLGQLND